MNEVEFFNLDLVVEEKIEPSQGLKEKKGELILLDRIVQIKNFVRKDNSQIECTIKKTNLRRTGLIEEPYLKKINDKIYGKGLEYTVNQHLILHPMNYQTNIKDLVSLEKCGIKVLESDLNKKRIKFCNNDAVVIRQVRDFSMHIGNEEVKDFVLNKYGDKGNEVYDYINGLLRDKEKLKEKKQELFVLEKVEELESLMGEERSLKNMVDFVYNSIKNGGFQLGNNFITIEDNDDALIASWYEKESLMLARQNIRKKLDEAINLGLHLNSYPYVTEHRNGRVTKNIFEFILELNSQYKS